MKLPSLRNVFKKPVISKPKGIPGSKVSTNGLTNTTGVTKTYATRGAARKAATSISRKPKPLQAANKRTFGQFLSKPKFGSMAR